MRRNWSDGLGGRLAEHGRGTWWALRRQGAPLVAAAVVLLGTPVLLLTANRLSAPPAGGAQDAVVQAAALLEADFAGNVALLDDSFVRKFAGADDESMVGTVARAGVDGICWGFTVAIPGTWLRDGTGDVVIGDVDQRDTDDCAT